MKRNSGKRGMDRPTVKSVKAKGPAKGHTKVNSHGQTPRKKSKGQDSCKHCSKVLSNDDRALFVEEEIGRIFCSEECISHYFNPDIQKLEKEYFRRLSPDDLSGDERENLAHLRWLTLQEPDEVWKEKTLSGDYRYTLIAEFQPELKKIWSVCICLFLRGEPSFLYIAFSTRNAAMVNQYRRGEQVQRQESRDLGRDTGRDAGRGVGSFMGAGTGNTAGHKGNKSNKSTHSSKSSNKSSKNISEDDPSSSHEEGNTGFVDGLADAWTDDETLRAKLTRDRNGSDIPVDEFSLYQSCLEETLEAPDEVWSLKLKEHSSLHLYYFLRSYPDETPGVWYIVIARETEDEEQIEILDAFPTRDSSLVEQFRRGHQEVGAAGKAPPTRMVH